MKHRTTARDVSDASDSTPWWKAICDCGWESGWVAGINKVESRRLAFNKAKAHRSEARQPVKA